MFVIKLQNYIMIFYKLVVINNISYQMIKRKKNRFQNKPEDLVLDRYDYSMQSENEEESEDLPPVPPLEGDEEKVKVEPQESIAERVKLNPQKYEGTELKILTPNKLLTRLPILLAQIKA